MPPKRPASTSSSTNPTGDPKMSKTDTDVPPPSKRWSKVSCSRNLDINYKTLTKDPAAAYSYVCMCKLPFSQGLDDDSDESDEDEGDGDEWETEDEDEDPKKSKDKGKPKAKCDSGRTCLCDKPAADHPDHKLFITMAGNQKFLIQHLHLDLRIPDLFDMYTFNDHASYGCLEVLQNLIIDFVEAEGNWREQWSICEATALLLMRDVMGPLHMLPCPDTPNQTIQIIGRMFLTVLAKLEREDVLNNESEVKNIGLMVAIIIKLADRWREDDILADEGETEKLKRCPGKTMEFIPSEFDACAYAYAYKHSIPVQGVAGVDDLVYALEDAELPNPADDPWKWSNSFKKYKREFGVSPRSKGGIGGDGLDITSWSSADRKEHSFDEKDPLGKNEIKALKEGLILQMG